MTDKPMPSSRPDFGSFNHGCQCGKHERSPLWPNRFVTDHVCQDCTERYGALVAHYPEVVVMAHWKWARIVAEQERLENER